MPPRIIVFVWMLGRVKLPKPTRPPCVECPYILVQLCFIASRPATFPQVTIVCWVGPWAMSIVPTLYVAIAPPLCALFHCNFTHLVYVARSLFISQLVCSPTESHFAPAVVPRTASSYILLHLKSLLSSTTSHPGSRPPTSTSTTVSSLVHDINSSTYCKHPCNICRTTISIMCRPIL